MNEEELYAEQMKHWFHEHSMMKQQLERTINHYECMAKSNKEQLTLHNKRLELVKSEYNAWAEKNGMPLAD